MFVNTRPVVGNFQMQSTRTMRSNGGTAEMAVIVVTFVALPFRAVIATVTAKHSLNDSTTHQHGGLDRAAL